MRRGDYHIYIEWENSGGWENPENKMPLRNKNDTYFV